MVYGDLQIFDIIIFAGIAIFLVFRLKNVLGKRTGLERSKEQNIESAPNEKQANETKTIPSLDDNLSDLKIAYNALEDFDHKSFLDGAKKAFETIINSFNRGDKKALQGLLTQNVFKSFEEAIDSKKINPEYQFYSLNIEKIESVVVQDGFVRICVKFVSEQFKNDDESTVVKKQDTWTFEKAIKSQSPNWLLSST